MSTCPAAHLAALADAGVAVRPGAAALALTQDKLLMRDRLTGLGVPARATRPSRTSPTWTRSPQGRWPVVLKAVSGGYDGRGVWVCESPAQAAAVLATAAGPRRPGPRPPGLAFLAEEYVEFDRELAVLAARSPHRQGAVYPVVETVQRDGICREVIAPAPGLAPGRVAEAQELALRLAAELGVTGLLAVELFETPGGLLVNELAMRPHNTGHWTIEGARTSQFEQHLRAVLDLPLGSPSLAAPVTAMANVLGGDERGHLRPVHPRDGRRPGASRCTCTASRSRPGRKIGHVTVPGDGSRPDPAELADRARRAASFLRWGKEDGE